MHAPLLEHHVALGRDNIVAQREARHAVGLERHAGLEVLLGHLLEVGGEVVAGKGVLQTANLGNKFGELALRMGLGALEHQVLEEMRDTRLARRIVGRAVAVPDHVGDDGGPSVWDNEDLEAVLKSEMGDLQRGDMSGHGNPKVWTSPP